MVPFLAPGTDVPESPMRYRQLLIALVVAVFFVVGLPGSAVAEHVTTTDASPTVTTQVTDAGTGAGPAAPCYIKEDGTVVCPCDDYDDGPVRCM